MKMTIRTAKDLAAETFAHEQGKASAYLSQTDWMILRQAETGVPVPADVLEARAQARRLLNS